MENNEFADNTITFSVPKQEILKFEENGDIYVKGKLIENDKEVVDGMREFLEESSMIKPREKDFCLSDKITNPFNELEFTREWENKQTVCYDRSNQWAKKEDIKTAVKKLKTGFSYL